MNRMKLGNLAAVMIIFLFSGMSVSSGQSVKDVDGNLYATTHVGKQEWMAENLKTTKFNDGTKIPLVADKKIWSKLSSPGYCWFNNNIDKKEEYGALYNFYTVSTKKLCPVGWHVPTQAEITNLITFLGDQNLAGNRIKEDGTKHWKSSITIVNNEFEFTALPGGFRLYSGAFSEEGEYGVWWSSTEYESTQAWNMGLYFNSTKLYNGHDIRQAGFSVRCLKNQ
jgi:uncharacterized protein (TIGR02145 family)